MSPWQVVTLLAVGLAYALGLLCAGHALMTKTRSSTSAMAWILFCIGLPLVGAFFYVTIGIDRVGRKRASALRESRARWRFLHRAHAPRLSSSSDEAEGPLFMEDVIERVTGAHVVPGNRLDLYVDGAEAYPAMLRAIESARESITVQFYIFDDDRVGKEFRRALRARAEAGVMVRVLYDAVGCAGTWSGFWSDFQAPNLRVEPFMPIRPFKRRWQVNLRNHRKLLVVDGATAFVGSMNIGGRHLTGDGGRSRDLMVRIQGPGAQAVQEVFGDDWYSAADEDLSVTSLFRDVPFAGDTRLQVLESGPDEGRPWYHRVLLSAVHQATTSITLVTPYFVPDISLGDALTLAARRGVKIDVVLPDHPDSVLVRLASRAAIHELLNAGAVVRRVPGPMLHMKLAVVDGDLVLLGSSNLDNRSFFLNFELDLAIHGRAFSNRILELVAAETRHASAFSPLEWLETTAFERFAVRFASLFAPIL